MIDTHCHIYFDNFDNDRDAVMERATQLGVNAMLMPCVDSATYDAMMTAATKYPHCRPMIGLHPTSVNANWKQELNFMLSKVSDEPSDTFVAIGEIGMDTHYSKDFLQEQKMAFAAMLNIAAKHDLPVVIHCRDAFTETIEVLKEHGKHVRGVFHAFSGDMDIYKQVKSLGDFKIGVGGVVTFKNANIVEVVRKIPLSEILLETDAPFLAPVPFRGKRNESAYLTYIVQKIADIKQLTTEEICNVTTCNAIDMFGIQKCHSLSA
jgi:TatD DNase family protein